MLSKGLIVKKKQKLISVPSDVLEQLDAVAKKNKISLKRYMEQIIIEKGREAMLMQSAKVMLQEYTDNQELTAFTELNTDDYYEAE